MGNRHKQLTQMPSASAAGPAPAGCRALTAG
jgi:hypothetical protein